MIKKRLEDHQASAFFTLHLLSLLFARYAHPILHKSYILHCLLLSWIRLVERAIYCQLACDGQIAGMYITYGMQEIPGNRLK